MAPTETDPRADRDDDVLRLDHALKLAGVAATGGQAKQLIQEGSVRVNGEVETRRKRKLVEGDVVEVGDESFEIALSDEDDGGDEDKDGHERGPGDAADAADATDADLGDPGADLGDPGEVDDLGDLDAFGDDVLELTPADLDRWATWVIDRMAEDDGEAVILRLGSLHPDALEALFGRLPADVEDAVLDALDEVLERGEHDAFGDGSRRDGPMEA